MKERLRIEDGIHENLSIDDYHGSEGYSSTTIKHARTSLKHFDWYKRGKLDEGEKSQFGFGNAFELALLAPQEYLQKVAVIPDQEWIDKAMADKPSLTVPRNSAVYKSSAAAWYTQNEDKYLINETGKESFEAIEEMLSSCFQDKVIQALIKNTEYQLSLYWHDAETGLQLKTRPDFCKRKKNVVVNLKTTLDGSPEGFGRDIAKYGYGLQAAIEVRGALACGLMDTVDNYFWLVVEKIPPYNAVLYDFDKVDLAFFDDELQFLLTKIKKCHDQGVWPGYTEWADNEYGILTAKIPAWSKIVRI